MTDNNETIETLLTETKSGEDQAFDQIAEQYRPLIRSCVSRFLAELDADELEQEALIALYRAACSYRPDGNNVSFGLYARICINHSLISLVRAEQKEKGNVISDDDIGEDVVGEEDPSVDFINRDDFHRLDRYIEEYLSPYEYRIYRLYLEGYRIKEIAALLGKSEKSAESAMTRLRVKLRRVLANGRLQ